MSAQNLVLNIAVNMGRLSRWSMEGRTGRINQFLTETESYLDQLNRADVNERFKPTLERFKLELIKLKIEPTNNMVWAEKALTWANILQHRAKLV